MSKLLTLIALLAFAVPAIADDLFPPDYFGKPLSVHAEWDAFNNGTTSAGQTHYAAEVLTSVDDSDPSTTLYNDADHPAELVLNDATSWSQLTGGVRADVADPNGVIAGQAEFHIFLPNWIDEMPIKHLRVQITYAGSPDGEPGVWGVSGQSLPDTGWIDGTFVFRSDTLLLPELQEYYFYEDWIFEPNPHRDFIAMSAYPGTEIHQVVVDTVSQVPEPATLSLLGLGGLAVLRRRKS